LPQPRQQRKWSRCRTRSGSPPKSVANDGAGRNTSGGSREFSARSACRTDKGRTIALPVAALPSRSIRRCRLAVCECEITDSAITQTDRTICETRANQGKRRAHLFFPLIPARGRLALRREAILFLRLLTGSPLWPFSRLARLWPRSAPTRLTCRGPQREDSCIASS
jgi:hypothetical protein